MRARRDDPMDKQVAVVAEDVQVAAKPRPRIYTAEYKRRILKEADAGGEQTPGGAGPRHARGGRLMVTSHKFPMSTVSFHLTTSASPAVGETLAALVTGARPPVSPTPPRFEPFVEAAASATFASSYLRP